MRKEVEEGLKHNSCVGAPQRYGFRIPSSHVHDGQQVLMTGLIITMSIRTLVKGGSTAGIGCRGATGGVWLGLPTIWQVWQLFNNSATSPPMPGHQKLPRRRARVF